jgi:Cu(I)/Ag(I) efflux system membrane fusion protein
MRHTKTSLHIGATLAGLGLILLSACSGRAGESRETPSGGSPAGESVALSPEAARTAGIKTEEAAFRKFLPVVRASGTVSLNQKRYVRVTPRFAGRIEKVFCFEGDHVRAGQDLFWIWSPDIMAVEGDYLQILSRVPSAVKESGSEDARLQESLARSTEARLELMGFEQADLAAVRANGRPLPVLAIRAPIAGTVVEAETATGSTVNTSSCLCAIADLGSLWVQVHIFEKDLAAVSPGDGVEISVAAYPGRVFNGTLEMIGSLMDEATRTVKGRVLAANPGGLLKPGMFADVRIALKNPVTALAVPDRAVRTFSGKTVVFCPRGDGTFVRRDIRTGREFEGYVEVVEGLKEGERVVTDGSFDVKAEMLKGMLEGEK